MAVMRVLESKYGAPAGIYVAKFLGVQPMKDDKPRLGKDGRPMEPGIEWQFEIAGGEDGNASPECGKIVGRITAAVPTTKNSCGTLLSGLVGKASLGPDEEVDPDNYRGKLYRVVIGPSRDDPKKTQVTQIFPMKGSAPPPAPRPASPRTPLAPPPTDNAPDPDEKWELWTGKNVVTMTRKEILTEIVGDPNTLGWLARKPGSPRWESAQTIEALGLGVPF